MGPGSRAWDSSFRRRWLSDDDARRCRRILAVVATYWVLDRTTRAIARLDQADAVGAVLVTRALAGHPLVVAGAVVVAVVGAVGLRADGRRRLRGPWTALEHGNVLRWLATPPLTLVAWYGTSYRYNYVLERWHAVDRAAVLVLVVAAWLRPAFVPLCVLQARVIDAQFELPTGARASQNIANLVTVTLLVLVAVHVVAAVTDDADSSAVIVVLATAIAAQFWVSGQAKLGLRWWSGADPGNFALSSYTAGWGGKGDGRWARSLASAFDTGRVPMIAGTVLLEVFSFVAVLRRRLLRIWLVGWAGFHAVVFATCGFVLLEWFVVEVGLFVVLAVRRLRPWAARCHTPACGVLAAAIVVGGGATLYRPPRLAWYDSPVAYGYEIEAVGLSGRTYHVPVLALAPLEQDVGFLFVHFRATPELAAGYGAVGWKPLLDQLAAVRTFDELAALERAAAPVSPAVRTASENLVLAWLQSAGAHDTPWFMPSPPPRYWTSRPDPSFDGDERLRSAAVVLVTSIAMGDAQQWSRVTVLQAEVDGRGRAAVTWRVGDGGGS